MGKKFKILEQFEEDGIQWVLGEMNTGANGPHLFRLPMWVMENKQITREELPDELKKLVDESATVYTDKNPSKLYCKAVTGLGERCKRKAVKGEIYCAVHRNRK